MKDYTNGEIIVNWDQNKCTHSGMCVRRLSKVFNTNARPWINMEGGNSKEIMKEIDNCPSKALSYKKK